MNKDISRILFSEAEIQARVWQIGEKITEDFKGKDVVFIGVLKGAFMFLSDLVRCVKLDSAVDFIATSSYGKTTTSLGEVRLTRELEADIAGKDVIVVEDILDTGYTLEFIKRYLEEKHPASVSICTLLDKPERRIISIKADYVGFTTPNEFVVGYGLDYNENYRALSYIGVLKSNIYQQEVM